MTNISRTTGVAAGCAGLALAIAGCGGGSAATGTGSAGAKAAAATAPASGAKLEVEVDDFYFKPQAISGKPGATKTLELHNEGHQAHTFTIASQGIDKLLKPGATATVEVKVPDKGSAAFICRFHHGMTGRITVSGTSGGSSSGAPRGYGY